MPSTRTENTARNIGWGFAYRLVALLGPFIIRTLLISRLGASYLGLSGFFSSVVQVLSLAELGFASAVAYGMYGPIARGDVHQVARYLAYFRSVYRKVGAVILVCGLAVCPFLGAFVKGSAPADVNMQAAFLIYLGNTVLGYFLFAYKQTLVSAHERKDLVDKVGMGVLAVQFSVQAAILLLCPNFYAYACVLPVCTVVGNVVVSHVADRAFPAFASKELRGLSLGEGERSDMRARVLGLMLQKACIVVRDALPAVLISAFVGLEAVAAFGNYFVVLTGLLGILGTVGGAMTASVGNSVAGEAPDKNFSDLRLFAFLYALVSIVCASCLISLYQPFVQLWVGEDMVMPFSFAVLMTAYFYVRTMGDMRTVYVNATGVWWDLRWRALAETVANVAFNLVLVQFLGTAGVVVATLLVLFVFNFLYGSHLVFKLYFGLGHAKAYYCDHFLYLGAFAVVCAVTYAVCAWLPDGGVVLLVVKGACAAVCAAALLAMFFFRTERFASAASFVRQAVQRRHKS